jgi:hypothetical protein
MFTGVCVSSISRGKGLRTIRVVGLSLGLLFLSGILHATPILTPGDSQLQNAKHRPGLLMLDKGKAVLRSAAANSVQSFTAAPGQQPSSGCFFAGNCANPVHLPESSALAVIGMGLLSIACLLRRRITHRATAG